MQRTLSSAAVLIAAAIAGFLPLTGCSEDSAGPSGNVLVKPKAGSMYIYTTTRYDASGAVESTVTDTMSILNTGITSGGITDLMSVWRSSFPNDTIYARYESNGDFAILMPSDTNSDGVTDRFQSELYPTGSHGRFQLDIDTLFDSGNAYTVSIDSMYYAGDQSVTVPAGTFTADKIVDVHDHRSHTSAGAFWSRVREVGTIHFAPSIGFFAKRTFEHEHIDTAGTLQKRTLFTLMELKSYQLK